MLRIGFGSPHPSPIEWGPLKGQMDVDYEYQLHVQAAWHLESDGKCVLKSGDRGIRSTHGDRSGDHVRQVLTRTVGGGVYRVVSVAPEGTGGAVIEIGPTTKLRISPPESSEWRLFEPAHTKGHFVVERDNSRMPLTVDRRPISGIH